MLVTLLGIVTSVKAEGGVVVLIKARVGHDVNNLRLKSLVKLPVMVAVASRERKEG